MLTNQDIDATGCGSEEMRRARGPYQQVYSGRAFFLLDPRPGEVDIYDIASSLSKVCRYNGHTKGDIFYSVAQHSVMVSHIVPPHMALWGLLHDAAETYTGDITRPMKFAIEAVSPGVLRRVNEPLDRAIAERFGIAWSDVETWHSEIKRADNIALATEKRDLIPDSIGCDWGPLPDPLAYPIQPLGVTGARVEFLLRFDDIMAGRAMAARQHPAACH